MKGKVIILSLSFLALSLLFFYQYFHFNDRKLHIVFCNVGQGDAIFIHTPGGKTILYDAGPNSKSSECISAHMPFWQRKLDLVILSHPHTDHFAGLLSVLNSYRVEMFASEKLENKALDFQKLTRLLAEKKILQKFVYAGDRFRLKDGVMLSILAPTEEYLSLTSPKNFIGESREFANVIVELSYGNFRALLTGDSQAEGLEKALKYPMSNVQYQISNRIQVLQVPHHGSKTGLNQEILDILKPRVAVISVGARNRYHHPNPHTIELLERNEVSFKRTDRDGEIEIISDGKNNPLTILAQH